VAFSPDGQYLASGSLDKTVRLWEVASGRAVRTLHGHTEAVVSVGFNPDGQYLASGGIGQTVKLWEVKSGREVRTLQRTPQGHTSGFLHWGVSPLTFSPDGQYLASGNLDNTVKLWETESGREMRTLQATPVM
jgi:WD40 repeat protein